MDYLIIIFRAFNIKEQKCFDFNTGCPEERKFSPKQQTVTYICVPRDSKALRSAKSYISDSSADFSGVESVTSSEQLREVIQKLEKSPRSDYREFSVDTC